MRIEWEDGLDKVKEGDTEWMSSGYEVFCIEKMDVHYIINCVAMLRKRTIRDGYDYEIPTLMLEKIDKFKDAFPEYFL